MNETGNAEDKLNPYVVEQIKDKEGNDWPMVLRFVETTIAICLAVALAFFIVYVWLLVNYTKTTVGITIATVLAILSVCRGVYYWNLNKNPAPSTTEDKK